MSNSENGKAAALQIIKGINAVDGFDPSALAVDYTDLNSGETRTRLPVMAQMAWFRLKYPEGRIAVSVKPIKDGFEATARVYPHYNDPVDCFLAEASASRGFCADKPNVSPREWAQTAAVGIALRNAGFGLQFHAAGESFDEPAFVEGSGDAPQTDSATASQVETAVDAAVPEPSVEQEPEPLTLETALLLPCPIAKHRGKTLGELVTADPGALVWIANKFTGEQRLIDAAKLICEESLKESA